MKTIEEAKISYCEKIASSTTMLRMDIIEQNMNAFDAGVEFAQMWIDINIEHPEFDILGMLIEPTLVKYKDGSMQVVYCFFDDINIAHWRKI